MLIALAIVTGLAGGYLQGFSGFGFSIFSMSVLSLATPLAMADRICCIMASTCIALLTARLWRHIEWRRLPWVAVGVAVGVPLGVWIGPRIPDDMGKKILGVIVISAALYRVWMMRRGVRRQEKAPGPPEVAFGFAAGILSGWVNMSGPPLIYWAHHRFQPLRARAILSGAFACAAVMKISSLTIQGLWIRECVIAGLCAIPAVLLGSWLGDLTARRSRPAIYAKLIWALFFALGALLLVMPAAKGKTTRKLTREHGSMTQTAGRDGPPPLRITTGDTE